MVKVNDAVNGQWLAGLCSVLAGFVLLFPFLFRVVVSGGSCLMVSGSFGRTDNERLAVVANFCAEGGGVSGGDDAPCLRHFSESGQTRKDLRFVMFNVQAKTNNNCAY